MCTKMCSELLGMCSRIAKEQTTEAHCSPGVYLLSVILQDKFKMGFTASPKLLSQNHSFYGHTILTYRYFRLCLLTVVVSVQT